MSWKKPLVLGMLSRETLTELFDELEKDTRPYSGLQRASLEINTQEASPLITTPTGIEFIINFRRAPARCPWFSPWGVVTSNYISLTTPATKAIGIKRTEIQAKGSRSSLNEFS